MSFIDDLNKAVGMFDQQMQAYKTTQAFTKATEQINQINTNVVKEMDKRIAINGAAQNLAQDLLAAGAPVERIKTAFSAFGAQALPSAEEQISVGTMYGDKETLNQGLNQQRKQSQVTEENFEGRAQRQHLRDLELMGLKVSMQGNAPLPMKVIDKTNEFESTLTQLDQINAQLATDKDLLAPISSRIPFGTAIRGMANPKFAAFRADVGRVFDNYRKLISGVAVSEKEMEDLKRNIPNDSDTYQQFVAKTRNFQKSLSSLKLKYLETVGKGGYNVNALMEGRSQTGAVGQRINIPDNQMPTIKAIPGLKMGVK